MKYKPSGVGDSIALYFQVPFDSDFETCLYAPHGRSFGNYELCIDTTRVAYTGYVDKDFSRPDSIGLGDVHFTAGTHRIVVRYTGKAPESTDSVIWIDYIQLTHAANASLTHQAIESLVTIQPNPATTEFWIENRPSGSEVQLIDVLGRVYAIKNTGVKFGVADLPRGVYMVRVENGAVGRLVLQ